MSTKLFVGNLPFTASDADLEAHFAQAGTVETVNVVRHGPSPWVRVHRNGE
jgi:RNA recognition motif-containing protein